MTGRCIFEGNYLEIEECISLCSIMLYFYCMTILCICLLTFFPRVTKKRKISTRESKITPFVPLNNSISPHNEGNDKDKFYFFQEEEKHEEESNPINS